MVPEVVVEVVPEVDVAVVAVVADVSVIVPEGIAEVEVVPVVSVAIVPLVEAVSVAIVDDVSVEAALVSVLLLFVSLLQAKPKTLSARTVRRTRSFLLMLFFPLVIVVVVNFGLEFDERVPAHPPWQLVRVSAKRAASQTESKNGF